MRKRAVFWRWPAISRSRRVRSDSSRLSASEASAAWRCALASAACGLGDLGRQGAHGERNAGAFQIHFLQFYEIFNMRLHPCYEVYGIRRAIKKMGAAESCDNRKQSGGGLARIGHLSGAGSRWLMWVAGGLLAAAAVAAGIVAVLLHRAEPFMRARIVEELQEPLSCPRGAGQLSYVAGAWMWAEGKGLRIWPPASGRRGYRSGNSGQDEPLIRLD